MCPLSLIHLESINLIVGEKKSQCGYRQGDHLSPYVFDLCAQALSTIINKATDNNLFRVVRIANNSPIVSHPFFADGNLVFFRATLQDCMQVKKNVFSCMKQSLVKL